MSIIRKLFVANRAEIALRIVRTARRLGMHRRTLAQQLRDGDSCILG